MSYFCAKTFKTREDAAEHLRKRGFTEGPPDYWTRHRNGVSTYVSVGPCRTGAYLVTVDAPPSPMKTWGTFYTV